MIKGITMKLAEGGKIKTGKLGEERTSGGGKKFRIPEKLDHFIVTKTTRDDKGDFIVDEALMAALPKDADGKCRALPIVLHTDEIDEVFPTQYALYVGRTLGCRGDGEKALRWPMKDGQRTGEVKEMACTCAYLNAASGPVCKPHGTLHCSILAPGTAMAGAVHRWRTTSLMSIERMLGSLHQILATCGTLRGLPLVLCIEPVRVQPAGKPASTVYCCHVELRATDLLSVQRKALELAQMRKTLSGDYDHAAYRAMIEAPAGDQETDDQQAEVAEEFHPEIDEAPKSTGARGTERRDADEEAWANAEADERRRFEDREPRA
jgi:hypothetical protein